MSRRLVALAVVATALALGGCGGDGDEPAQNAEPATTADASTQTAAVDIKVFQFSPKRLEIAAGTKVTWTNKDEILHTATGDGFDGVMDGKGKTFSFTFDEAGTFAYRCTRHPGMDATVVVS